MITLKQEPFLNIDDELWYQYIHYYEDEKLIDIELSEIVTGKSIIDSREQKH